METKLTFVIICLALLFTLQSVLGADSAKTRLRKAAGRKSETIHKTGISSSKEKQKEVTAQTDSSPKLAGESHTTANSQTLSEPTLSEPTLSPKPTQEKPNSEGNSQTELPSESSSEPQLQGSPLTSSQVTDETAPLVVADDSYKDDSDEDDFDLEKAIKESKKRKALVAMYLQADKDDASCLDLLPERSEPVGEAVKQANKVIMANGEEIQRRSRIHQDTKKAKFHKSIPSFAKNVKLTSTRLQLASGAFLVGKAVLTLFGLDHFLPFPEVSRMSKAYLSIMFNLSGVAQKALKVF